MEQITAEQAIEWIRSIEKKYIHGGDEAYDSKRKYALNMAIDALEKQIPKSLNDIRKIYAEWNKIIKAGRCPCCNAFIFETYSTSTVCVYCGQRLRWYEQETF